MSEQSPENDAPSPEDACPRCGGRLVPYWFTYGGPMEVCEDPGCNVAVRHIPPAKSDGAS